MSDSSKSATESRSGSTDGVGDIAIARGALFFLKCRLDRREQGIIAVRLFQEIACARFHRTNGRLDVALGGNDNDRQIASHPVKLCLDIQAVYAWQANIE